MADRDDSRDDNFDDVFEQLFDLDSAMDAYDKASKEYLETTKRFLRATDAEEIRHLAKLHDEQQDLVDSFMADLEDTYDFLADGLSDTDAVAYETLVTNRMRDLNAFDRGYRKHLQNLRKDTEIFADDIETEVEDVFSDIREQIGGLADIANMFNIAAIKDMVQSGTEEAVSSMHDLQKSLNLSGAEMDEFKAQLTDVAGSLSGQYGGKISNQDLFAAAQDAINIGIRNTEDVAAFAEQISVFKAATDLEASSIQEMVKSVDQWGYDKNVIKDLTDSVMALSSNTEADRESILEGVSTMEGKITSIAGSDEEAYRTLEESAMKAATIFENAFVDSSKVLQDFGSMNQAEFIQKYARTGVSGEAYSLIEQGNYDEAAMLLARGIAGSWEDARGNEFIENQLIETYGLDRTEMNQLANTYRDSWDTFNQSLDEFVQSGVDGADQAIKEMHKTPWQQFWDNLGLSGPGMSLASFFEDLDFDMGDLFTGATTAYGAFKGAKAGFKWFKNLKQTLTGVSEVAESAEEAGGFFSRFTDFGKSLFKNFGKESSASTELAKAADVANQAGKGTSFFSKLGDAGKSLFGKVQSWGKSAFDFIKGKGAAVLEKAPSFLDDIVTRGGSFIDDIVSRGGKFIGNIASKGGSFVDDIVTKGGGFLAKAGTSIGSYASKAGAVLSDWAGPLAVAADAVMGGFQSGEWFKGEEQNGSTVAASAIGGALGGTGPGILDEGSVLDKGLNLGGGALKGAAVGASIGSVIPGLGTAIGAAVGAGVGAVGSAIGGENIAKFFKPVTDGIGNAFNYAIDNIEVGGESLRDHFDEVGQIWADDSKDLLTKIGDTFTWGLDFLGQGLMGIGDWLGGIGKGVGDFFGGIWDWGTGVVSNLWDGFKGENKDLIDNALNNNAQGIANTYGVSAAEAIPSYDVGTPFVAQDQLAMLHQGEAVLTKDENQGLFGTITSGLSGITEIFDATVGAPMKIVGVREKAGLALAENFMTVFDKNRQWWSSVFGGASLGFAQSESGTGGTGIIDDSAPSTITGSQGDFINSIKGGAIQSYKDYGVLPSITLAQAILESGWGKSAIGNNLFGIKAGSGWTGKTKTVPTTEYINGQTVHITDTFRDYDSIADSVRDHGKFFVDNSRYADMFNYKDYVGQANAIAKAGYATSPTYADSLIQLIKQFNLDQWDPKYAEGTPWVPDDQIALIHRGEMVVPADVNPISNPAPVAPIESTTAQVVPNAEQTLPNALSGLSDDAIRELIRVVSQGIQFIGRKMDEQSANSNNEVYSPAQAVTPMFFGG